jgi:hypothetical protein
MTAQAQVNPHTQIRWPANCNQPNMIYNWQTNTCFSGAVAIAAGTTTTLPAGSPATVTQTGTFPNYTLHFGIPTGTPGGSLSYPGVNTDNNQGLTAAGNIVGKTLGGFLYASQYITGAGNNGIGNAAATGNNITVVADPATGSVERPGPGSFTNYPIHYWDSRISQQTDFFYNPEYGSANWSWFNAGLYGVSAQAGKNTHCLYDRPPPYYTGNVDQGCENGTSQMNYPGWSLGNPNGFLSATGNVTTNGTAVTWSSGTTFRTDATWPNQIMLINGAGYVVATVNSATSITLATSAGVHSTPVPYLLGAGAGWSVLKGRPLVVSKRGRGIDVALPINDTTYSPGDHIAFYSYLHGHGGGTAASDEYQKNLGNLNAEDPESASTCLTGCSTGTTLMKTNYGSAGTQGAGMYMIAGSSPAYTLTMTASAAAASPNGAGTAVTVADTIPVSTAWGTITVAVQTPVNVNPPYSFSTPVNITLAANSPGPFTTTGGLICFMGNFHDQTFASSVGTATTTQIVTVPVRNAHAAGTYVYQGGMCGKGQERVMDTVSGQQYLYDVGGSTDAHTLQAYSFVGSAGLPLPQLTMAPFNNVTAGLSSSGTTIAGTLTGGLAIQAYTGATVAISNSSNSALNVSACTGLTFTTATAFTCTVPSVAGNVSVTNGSPAITWVSGAQFPTTGVWTGTTITIAANAYAVASVTDATHLTLSTNISTATSGNVAYAQTIGTQTNTTNIPVATVGNNTLNLWDIAEITDAQNEAVNPPAIDGTVALEPNTLPVTTNGAVKVLNHTAAKQQVLTGTISALNPYEQVFGINIVMGGPGAWGGSNGLTGNAFVSTANSQPCSYYTGCGGSKPPANWGQHAGSYLNGIDFALLPSTSGSSLLTAGISAATQLELNDPNYFYYVFFEYDKTGNTSLKVAPLTGNSTFNTQGTATYTAASHIFNGGTLAANFTTLQVCSTTLSPANCNSASSGRVQVAVGATTLQINSTVFTGVTGCWFTYDGSTGTPPTNIGSLIQPYISGRSPGVSLTITLPVAPATNPVYVQFGCMS